MDRYIFRDGNPETPPANWQSKFGGKVWEYVPYLNTALPDQAGITSLRHYETLALFRATAAARE